MIYQLQGTQDRSTKQTYEELVLDRIQEYKLHLKKSNYTFFQKELEFLGHLITKDGEKSTESRIKSVQEAPPQKNKQELQSFLGMTTYNAKFMPSLSHI